MRHDSELYSVNQLVLVVWGRRENASMKISLLSTVTWRPVFEEIYGNTVMFQELAQHLLWLNREAQVSPVLLSRSFSCFHFSAASKLCKQSEEPAALDPAHAFPALWITTNNSGKHRGFVSFIFLSVCLQRDWGFFFAHGTRMHGWENESVAGWTLCASQRGLHTVVVISLHQFILVFL